MHQTHNTLPELVREHSAVLLNRHLAAAIDLQAQIRHAHWNVRGPGFIGVHKLFDTVSNDVGADADRIAERCAALGSDVGGTIQTAVAQSFLVPWNQKLADVAHYWFAVSAVLAAFSPSAREAAGRSATFGDSVTADLLEDICLRTDQNLGLVEANMAPHNDKTQDEAKV